MVSICGIIERRRTWSCFRQLRLLRERIQLAARETANCEMTSATRLCWSAVKPANMGKESISSAAASVSGKSPRFQPLEEYAFCK